MFGKILCISLALLPALNSADYASCNCANAQYLKDKIPKSNVRYSTFLHALNLLQERNAHVLVETGTARNGATNCQDDGCSTLIFAEWVKQHGGQFYSVDISKDALQAAEASLGDTKEYAFLVQSDSVKFLKNFGRPIDFLYLDSFDFDFENPLPSQQHHYKEILAAYPWLTPNSVVMIDDCDLPHGGKGKLAIELLVSRGWKIAAQDYQTILIHQ